MSKLPFIHYHKDKSSLINTYFIALIPLLIFGIYKNGILLYMNDLINFKYVFLPLYFYIISIVVSTIISFIYKESYKENILISLILASTISINTNMVIYPILLFVSMFIFKYIINKFKFSFNYIALVRLLLILSLLFNSYSYLNIGEKLDKFNYNLFDIFLGHASGGLATTSTLLLLVSLVILSFNKFYKKSIAITSILSYIIISLSYLFISKDYSYLNVILSSSAYFSFIFIAPDIEYTPNNSKMMIGYGALIGIFTSVICIMFNVYEASYISIFIISLLIPVFNKISGKISFKQA